MAEKKCGQLRHQLPKKHSVLLGPCGVLLSADSLEFRYVMMISDLKTQIHTTSKSMVSLCDFGNICMSSTSQRYFAAV